MYWVLGFKAGALETACALPGVRDAKVATSKAQISRIETALDSLDCKTILVEEPYVDRDYLEDHGNHYVYAFKPYERYCRRLSFFKGAVTSSELEAATSESSGDGSNPFGEYLGSLVLRPLPQAIVGRCTVAPPGLTHTRRMGKGELEIEGPGRDAAWHHFPTLRDYEAHLAGRTFRVESLAFQEQDVETAACATAATWTALHKAAKIFGVQSPTPSRITLLAGRDVRNHARPMPSPGLYPEQIARAIVQAGLEVVTRAAPKGGFPHLKGLVYAYLRAGIPVILGLRILDLPNRPGHAVAVTGYEIGVRAGQVREQLAESIGTLYVHDDQLGPFTPAKIIDLAEVSVTADSSAKNASKRVLQNLLQVGATDRQYLAEVTTVIVPVDSGVRIEYETFWTAVSKLDEALSHLLPKEEHGDLEWDVHLSTLTGLMEDLRAFRGSLQASDRRRLLIRNWPKYVWRATGRTAAGPVMEAIGDSSDISRSYCIESVAFYEGKRRKEFATALESSKGVVPPETYALLSEATAPIPTTTPEDWNQHLLRIEKRAQEARTFPR